MSKTLKPTCNDVMIYDGQDWYVTTKENILKDANTLLEQCKNELDTLKKENADFKVDIAKQLLEMSELIKKLYSK